MSRSKSKRKKFDAFIARIVLIEIGVFFTIISIFGCTKIEEFDLISTLLITFFLIFGSFFLISGIVLNDKKADDLANKTGNHELLFLFVLIAYGIAYIIRRSKSAT